MKDNPALASKEVLDLRKRAGVPELDPDALPSSCAAKMMSCLLKRIKKLNDLHESFTDGLNLNNKSGNKKDPTEVQSKRL